MDIYTTLSVLFFLWLLWFSFRYAWWRGPVSFIYPRILMYHQIAEHIEGARFNGLRVSPELFEKQLIWLTENGWNFMTMAQLINAKDKLPSKTVVLTFDDGFEDNFTNALPLMKKYNACGTLYLVIDRHDNDWSTNKKQHHNSGELVEDKKLTDEQIKALIESNIFEIAAHTYSHANLNQLDRDAKIQEICEAKKYLEQHFNINVSSFAYPFGIYSREDIAIVRNCGYSSAVTTEAGIESSLDSPLQLKRIKISGKDGFYGFKLRIRTGIRGWKK